MEVLIDDGLQPIGSIDELVAKNKYEAALITKAKKKGIEIGAEVVDGIYVGMIGDLYFAYSENGSSVLQGFFSYLGGSHSVNVNDKSLRLKTFLDA